MEDPVVVLFRRVMGGLLAKEQECEQLQRDKADLQRDNADLVRALGDAIAATKPGQETP